MTLPHLRIDGRPRNMDRSGRHTGHSSGAKFKRLDLLTPSLADRHALRDGRRDCPSDKVIVEGNWISIDTARGCITKPSARSYEGRSREYAQKHLLEQANRRQPKPHILTPE
jgi:hypothetical protein